MSNFLLEILIQEIPAGMQVGAQKALAKAFVTSLAEQGVVIDTKDVEATTTPRRLILTAKNLPTQTDAKEEEKRGPKVGAPEQALKGFMKGCGVENEKDLSQKDGYYVFTKTSPARPMVEVLANLLPGLVTGLPWPKSMRWADGSTPTFVRPIENILAALDGRVVPFDVVGIQSSNQTHGHDFLAPEPFTVTDFDQYKKELTQRFVLIDREERRAHITNQLTHKARDAGANVVENQKLVDEVTGLVEHPIAILGQFDEDFLTLPREVLEITMASHQRYFALEDEKGNITNSFVGISNIEDKKGSIQKGYEKVLTARFNDAAFYWKSDCALPLENRLSSLEKIIFHEELGNLHEKTHRLEELTELLDPYIPGVEKAAAVKAARLSKCDLVTGVVGEFPELQGVIGSYLAEKHNENPKTAHALRWQYEHNNLEGLPPEAVALILADRLDTLVGFFGIGQPPTGSKDPYALRRAALTVIKLLRAYDIRLSLKEVIGAAHAFYKGKLKEAEASTVDNLLAFFMNRLQVILKEEGVAHDKVDAVFALGLDDVVDVARRSVALQNFMNQQDGAALFEAFKRAKNILDKESVNGAVVEKSLLAEQAEKDLFTEFEDARIAVKKALESEAYDRAMSALTALRTPVDGFFNDVLVMAEDENLKKNRLALLKEMASLFGTVAHFDRVGG